MRKAARAAAVSAFLKAAFPNASCALKFSNPRECLIAIILSAQTTDLAVNKVTPSLFSQFPSWESLAEAPLPEIEETIKSLGLYRNKAKSIKAIARVIVNDFRGEIPKDIKVLKTLPGVGLKTAGVFLLETSAPVSFPVDTHVGRLARRLGLSKEKEPGKVAADLEKAFPQEDWAFLHHALILFGRETCKSQNPHCQACKLGEICLSL